MNSVGTTILHFLRLPNWDAFTWTNISGMIGAPLGKIVMAHILMRKTLSHMNHPRKMAVASGCWLPAPGADAEGAVCRDPPSAWNVIRIVKLSTPSLWLPESSDNSSIFSFSPKTARTLVEKHCSYCPEPSQLLLEETFPKQCPLDFYKCDRRTMHEMI